MESLENTSIFSRDVISGINTGTQSHQNNAIQKYGEPLLFQLRSKHIALRASAPPTLSTD